MSPQATGQRLTPLKQRIVDALLKAPNNRLCYQDLAGVLWPYETNPKAWRYSSNGGPPGWAMPLGKALREMHKAGIAQAMNRADGGPGHGDVVLLPTYFQRQD